MNIEFVIITLVVFDTFQNCNLRFVLVRLRNCIENSDNFKTYITQNYDYSNPSLKDGRSLESKKEEGKIFIVVRIPYLFQCFVPEFCKIICLTFSY